MEAGRRSVVRGLVRGRERRRAAASAFGALSDLILTGRSALPPTVGRAAISTPPTQIAAAQRFFHWELEFPEVFFDRRRRRQAATPDSTR